MDMELLTRLDDAIALANKLLVQLERDKAEISLCIQGEILQEYNKGEEKSVELLTCILQQLLLLQQEQMASLLLL